MADLSLGRSGIPATRHAIVPLPAPDPARGFKWHLAMLAVACAVYIPLAAMGGTPAAASTGLAPIGLAVLAGGFLSGAGARLVSGAGRNRFTVARRQAPLAAALGGILAGAALGSVQAGWWQGLPALAAISLPTAMGWLPALVLSIAVLASAAGFTILFEKIEPAPRRPMVPFPATATLVVAAGLALPAAGIWIGGGAGLLDATLLAGGIVGLSALGRIAGGSPSRAGLGGLLLGYGALIGPGGLVGAHVTGVAAGSLHGWAWLAAALAGAWLAGARRSGVGSEPENGADGGT